jgi:DNA (cytosine-5)-methyltransferase 1
VAGLRVGSLASGIAADAEAARQAGLPWRHMFMAENAKFPSQVLKHRYPGVPNLGDITRPIDGLVRDCGIDLLFAGTPCQSFSAAGLRGGMDDPRGQLALRFAQLAAASGARWVCWENVPGALTADGGEAFRSIVSALVELGYGVAWRILDAQHFGLAQRRKRVFLVGYLGDWRPAAAVLLEPQSVPGNPASGGPQGSRAPSGARGGADGGGGIGAGVVGALGATGSGRGHRVGADEAAGGHVVVVSHALNAKSTERYDASVETFVAQTVVIPFETDQITHPENRSLCLPGSPAPTLAKRANAPAVAIGFYAGQGFDGGGNDEISPTLKVGNEGGNRAAVAISIDLQNTRAGGDLAGTLDTTRPSRGGGQAVAFNLFPGKPPEAEVRARETDKSDALSATALAMQTDRGTRIVQAGVRRLTPTECERLMGYPDGYTLIPGAADGPRYAALGNSIAVPVLSWIFKRIAFVDAAATWCACAGEHTSGVCTCCGKLIRIDGRTEEEDDGLV